MYLYLAYLKIRQPKYDDCAKDPTQCIFVSGSSFGKHIHDCDIEGWKSMDCNEFFFCTVGTTLTHLVQAAANMMANAPSADMTEDAATLLRICHYKPLHYCLDDRHGHTHTTEQCMSREAMGTGCVRRYLNFDVSPMIDASHFVFALAAPASDLLPLTPWLPSNLIVPSD